MTDQNKPDDDLSEYLPTFLDETDEQLDDLIETMLILEHDLTSPEHINEAFRLIHSIKGSAGLLGLDSIAVLTHHLENRFERFRSQSEGLDEPTVSLVLRCIDFLRECNNRLREGESLTNPGELLDELKQLDVQTPTDTPEKASDETKGESSEVVTSDSSEADDELIRMVVRFRAGLPLADLKAQLIVARLTKHGEVRSTNPTLESQTTLEDLEHIEIHIQSDEQMELLRAAADVEGVETIEFVDMDPVPEIDRHATEPTKEPPAQELIEHSTTKEEPPLESTETASSLDHADRTTEPELAPIETKPPSPPLPVPESGPVDDNAPSKVTETMRVDIDRLDNLMNLTGQLVVNRSRFAVISEQMNPELRKTTMLNRVRDFAESLRKTIDSLTTANGSNPELSAHLQQLKAGAELMDEQAAIWDSSRHCFVQLGEAIDQLTRVSYSLQRGVLETRMVPVGPLFSRFKRVIRDLARGCGKKVELSIRGEKTELDKRMIDELGDPLVHLVRNSIDHGLESPEVRADRGKPEVGHISLEATHSGNNVCIQIRDDGGGVDVERIKSKIVENQILHASIASTLSDEQALDHIWHPGFSTAKSVTDVSGRGVGMDVVKTRINELNGTIEIDSIPLKGTTFTIRLPLTLAIINCLLVRLNDAVFAIPIDDVREIVSVKEADILTVGSNKVFDVRGELLGLVSHDSVFYWHNIDYGHNNSKSLSSRIHSRDSIEVVILNAGGNNIGLRVDELLGSQDIVVKSLSSNFINIPGLSGASILGDGNVCLMLDSGAIIESATQSSPSSLVMETTN